MWPVWLDATISHRLIRDSLHRCCMLDKISACRAGAQARSLVSDVEDLLLASEATVSDLDLGLVEWLRLVETVTV